MNKSSNTSHKIQNGKLETSTQMKTFTHTYKIYLLNLQLLFHVIQFCIVTSKFVYFLLIFIRNMNIWILQHVKETVMHLTHISNCSLITGIFPERCKFAIVRPIFKKGGHKEMNNYRPMSLLTSISKILETIMFKRFVQHFESNNILTSTQFGFRKDVHIDDAVFSLLNNIITLLDQQKCVGGIFLWFDQGVRLRKP